MEPLQIVPGAWRIPGSVWGGALVSDGHALLIDVPETPPEHPLAAMLESLGIHTVDRVLLTQHRRSYAGGLCLWEGPLPPVSATPEEAVILSGASKTWESNRFQYHNYNCIPDRFLPLSSLPVEGDIRDGVPLYWRGWTITPVVFGALSHGDCAYVADNGQCRVAFCGGLAMAGGQIHDLYTLQKALPRMMGYHGFLGGLPSWLDGCRRLQSAAPQLLSPAYGPVETDPEQCLALLRRRLVDYAEAYVAISAVRYYFPEEFHQGFEVPTGVCPPVHAAPTTTHPAWLFRIGETTSYLLRSASGRGILIDAGDPAAVSAVEAMVRDGELAGLDACWITHAHDDHLEAVWALTFTFGCQMLTTAAVAEVCSYPAAWQLPCLHDGNIRFRVLADGASWQWEGFTLTALHFPGQCIHHAGLLVEKDGQKVLLCGDSFAPTGLDDYCAANRNLPGRGRGYGRCVELLEQYGVEQLVNEHQSEPFLYDRAFLRHLQAGMERREALLAELLPDDIGLGLDNQWMRCWPAEQTVTSGAPLRLSIQITGHGRHRILVSPRLPWTAESPVLEAETEGLTSGTVMEAAPDMPADLWCHLDLTLPDRLTGSYRIPWDCWLDGRYLGTYLTCQLHILPG